ncbi:MAG: hypothetical protein AMXMBFR34_48130 [Myxococcaceae bacterium]
MELNVVVEQQAFGGYLLPRSAEVLLTPGLLAALQDRLRRAQVDSHWDVLDAALHLFERALSSSVRRFYAADGPPLLELVADAEELDQLDRRLEQKLRSLPLRHAPTPLPPTPPRAIPRTESPPRPTPPSVRRSTARRVVTPPVLCKQRLADAVYGSHSTLKSCPPCSKRLGMHAFYPLKLFGLRRVGGKDILQSWCAACRAERRPPTPTAWCAGLQTR